MKMIDPQPAAGFFGAQIEFPDTAALRAELLKFGSNLAAKHLGAALKASSKPAVDALRRETPRGPTGNLRAAIMSKVVTYPKDGNAVLLVGYRAAGSSPSKSASGGSVRKGKDRAFHAGWIEFGTNFRTISDNSVGVAPYKRRPHARRTKNGYVGVVGHTVGASKGSIASSFNELGPFSIKRSRSPGRVSTSPKYPKAFFMRAAKNQKPNLGRVTARAPIATAFAMSATSMSSLMKEKMGIAVQKAKNELAYRTQMGI